MRAISSSVIDMSALAARRHDVGGAGQEPGPVRGQRLQLGDDLAHGGGLRVDRGRRRRLSGSHVAPPLGAAGGFAAPVPEESGAGVPPKRPAEERGHDGAPGLRAGWRARGA